MDRSRFVRFAAAAALVVGVVAASAPAFAQVYAGARGSAFLPNGRDAGLKDFDTGWGVEGFVGLPFASSFALEAGVGYYRTEWSDEEDVIKESSTVSAIPLTLTVKGYVPLSDRGRLYAGGGVGAYFAEGEVEGSWKEESFVEVSASDSSKDTAFGYHVVFGGEFTVSPNLTLDAQVRWLRAEPTFSFFGGTDAAASPQVDIGGVMLSVGVLFRLL